ncbi:MAG: tetratricopeptide repeat protein, partial [Vitreoscilla sp.]|nr:tetratricopeptide repeat protein [Vitreoscilla sp.]
MDDKQAAAWRELLGRIAAAHHQGATALSRAALAALREQTGDDEPVRSWIEQTAGQLGCEDSLQALVAQEGFVAGLFEQSRQALAAGDAQLGQIGFAAAAAMTQQDPQSQTARGWMILGQVASLLALQATDAARDLALSSLGIADDSPEAPIRESEVAQAFEQAVKLSESGQHAEAVAMWHRLQAWFDALPDSNDVRSDRSTVCAMRAGCLQDLGAHEAAEMLYARAQELVDDLPVSVAACSGRAGVRVNRATNLRDLGYHEAAEALYSEAQHLFDDLPESDAVCLGRARVRMNRANNLLSLGAHEMAETLYDQAQELFGALPVSNAVRVDRARVRMNRANNLQRAGAHEIAEALYCEAQRLVDDLPDGNAFSLDRSERARVRMNRASNLSSLGALEAAEELYSNAQSLFDDLPDGDAARPDQARVRMGRANNMHRLHAYDEAAALYREARDFLDTLPDSDAVQLLRMQVQVGGLRTHRALGKASSRSSMGSVRRSLELVTNEAADVPRLWTSLAREVARSSQAKPSPLPANADCAMSPELAQTLLDRLCQAALDWLDLMARPAGAGTVPGAADVAATIGTALSWLVGSGR